MIKCDEYFDNVASDNFDLILLVGGQGNSEDLSKCNTLIELLKKQKKNNKYK
jgi:putative intracellular protease/amidase